METAKIPKFDWNKAEENNAGHTKDEWGQTPKDKTQDKIRVIEAYTVVWDTSESKSPSGRNSFSNKKVQRRFNDLSNY